MSWIMNPFSSSSSSAAKSNIPPTTALQQQRLKQIDTLKTFHHSVTEVQRDVEYRVAFNIGTSTVFLNISLPAQFPNEKAIVKVSPPLQHPWVNDKMVVVGCPALNMFYMHSSLGKAVQEVVREFCENPPQFNTQAVPASSGAMSTEGIGGYQSSSTYSFSGYQPQVTPFSSTSFGSANHSQMFSGAQPSTISTSQIDSMNPDHEKVTCRSIEFPELNGLSLEELKDLNDCSESLENFIINKLESVKNLQNRKKEIIQNNETLARYNLSLQPKFEACKDSILRNHELLSTKTLDFAKKSQQQKDLAQYFSLSNIHTNMELAAAEAEQDSEDIADKFLYGEIKTEEFLQKFMIKRRLCHLRRAKEEKLRNVHTHF